MPSFFSVAAMAAIATVASAQFTNTTAPAAAVVGGWTYTGCAVSTANTGNLVDTSSSMTVERCLLDCSAYAYARIQGNNCFCASSTNGTSPVAETQCNTPCPGNAAEACGGSAAAGRRRQAAGTVVSVYARQAVVPAGNVYVTVINNIYIDYCPAVQALTTVTALATVTLTGCGCTTTAKPTIPVTTTVIACNLGSTTSTVTLTVPSGVVAGTISSGVATVTVGATATAGSGSGSGSGNGAGNAATTTVGAGAGGAATATPTKAVYTGAASANKVGGGLFAGAIVVAALL